jgi:hypothetical protein
LSIDRETLVAHTSGIAKASVCACAGSIWRDAKAAEFLLAHGEVEGELVVDVALDGALTERQPE